MEIKKEVRNGVEVHAVYHDDGKEHSVHMSEAGAKTAVQKASGGKSFYDAVSKKDKPQGGSK